MANQNCYIAIRKIAFPILKLLQMWRGISKDIVFKIFIDKSKDSVFFNDYSCKDISESLFGSFLI